MGLNLAELFLNCIGRVNIANFVISNQGAKFTLSD